MVAPPEELITGERMQLEKRAGEKEDGLVKVWVSCCAVKEQEE